MPSLFSQLVVPALRCAGFHLMWAKLNAVKSTSTQVFISVAASSEFLQKVTFNNTAGLKKIH